MTEAKHSPLPELPTPKVTYADHSYPAFSKQQVTDYAQQAIVHSTSLHHELVAALEPFAKIVVPDTCRDGRSIMCIDRLIVGLTIGQLRAAHAAFQKAKQGDPQ